MRQLSKVLLRPCICKIWLIITGRNDNINTIQSGNGISNGKGLAKNFKSTGTNKIFKKALAYQLKF